MAVNIKLVHKGSFVVASLFPDGPVIIREAENHNDWTLLHSSFYRSPFSRSFQLKDMHKIIRDCTLITNERCHT